MYDLHITCFKIEDYSLVVVATWTSIPLLTHPSLPWSALYTVLEYKRYDKHGKRDVCPSRLATSRSNPGSVGLDPPMLTPCKWWWGWGRSLCRSPSPQSWKVGIKAVSMAQSWFHENEIQFIIMHLSLFLLLLPLFLISQLLLRIERAALSSLKDIPGPFWTRFTSLWYLNKVRHGNFEHENIRLHQKYGSIVRIAPNQYSISDHSAIKTVYGPGSQFAKSAWYDGWKHPAQWTVFADRNIKRHCKCSWMIEHVLAVLGS